MQNHHAYVYYTSTLTALPAELQVPAVDVVHLIEPQWGIGHSRSLIAAAANRPVAGDTRSFVLHVSSMTHEAQNALLKLFEDPPTSAAFHLVIPQPERLLETVRSRLAVAYDAVNTPPTEVWSTFYELPVAQQLAEIAERAKAKDTVWQHAILEAAIQDGRVPADTRLLLDTYGQQRGASRKMLLEALTLAIAEA